MLLRSLRCAPARLLHNLPLRFTPCVVLLGLINIFILVTLHSMVWPSYQEHTQEYEVLPQGVPNFTTNFFALHAQTFSGGSTNERDNITLRFKPRHAQLIGFPRWRKGFLTIGIPTINRHQMAAQYLKETITSLLTKMGDRDRDNVTILVYVADFNQTFQSQMIHYFTENHSNELSSGLILLLLADQREYPRLHGLPRNYNDSEERVKWRSKQVVDFAYMFYYGRNLSEYYMQLEDDIIAAKDYVRKIREFIHAQRKPWVTLQFCALGFIGKLYRSSELPVLYDFLMLFYDQMPVDWLYIHFASLRASPDIPMRKPTLFQHKGRHSSLQLKSEVKLRDVYFEEELKPKPRGDNPKAKICTNIVQFKDFEASYAYNSTWPIHFFWGRRPKARDFFSLQFEKPQRVLEVEVVSGHEEKRTDIITDAHLQLGYATPSRLPHLQNCTCDTYKTFSNFTKGHSIIPRGRISSIDNLASCIRIYFEKAQNNWVIISNIIVHIIR